jgi:hypothetical protein
MPIGCALTFLRHASMPALVPTSTSWLRFQNDDGKTVMAGTSPAMREKNLAG